MAVMYCSESCYMNMCFQAKRAGFFDTLHFALTTLCADQAGCSMTLNIAVHCGCLRWTLTFLNLSPRVLRAGLPTDKYQFLWQRPLSAFPQWAHRPLDESDPSLLWDDLSSLTSVHLHPDQQSVKGMSPSHTTKSWFNAFNLHRL